MVLIISYCEYNIFLKVPYVLAKFASSKKEIVLVHKQNINTIIGSFEMRVSCGSTDPANLATSGAFPTVVHNDMVIYIPCENGGEAFFDGFGG